MIRFFHIYFPSRIVFLVLSEALLIIGALALTSVFWLGRDFELALVYEQGIFKIGIAATVVMLCMYYYDLYDSDILHRSAEVLTRLVQVLGTASVLLAVLYYAYPNIQIGRGPFVIWIALTGVILSGWRGLFYVINRLPRLARRTILVGSGPMATRLCSEIESRPELGLRLVGYVEAPAVSDRGVNGLRYLGRIENLRELIEHEQVGSVILTMSERRGRLPVEMLLNLKAQGLAIQNAADVYEAVTGRVSLDSLRPSSLLFSDGFQVSRYTLLYKRISALVLSILGIVATAPLMLLIAVAIRLDSVGPVLFRQRRVGRGGKIFTIYKFRSMRLNADQDGSPRAADEKDDRVTRAGHWMRRLHLDELPQLFNILRGEMSFVGPRPFTPNMEAEFSQKIPFYAQRWLVKPGATGWAQVRRGYCATLDDNIEKLSYDLYYIKNLSIGLDCIILLHTVKILLLGRGGR